MCQGSAERLTLWRHAIRITVMTTTPGESAKTLTQLVALEIRLEMVRQDTRQSELARKIHKTEQWLSVRLRGRQPIDVNDLALIAWGLGVPVHKLLPDPDTASTAAVEPMVRYVGLTESMSGPARRPRDNRPPRRKAGVASPLTGHTYRLPRP
jgi:transcriptional regulator with XRE-family HTH domain